MVAFESDEDACFAPPLPVCLFAEPGVTWDKGDKNVYVRTPCVCVGER